MGSKPKIEIQSRMATPADMAAILQVFESSHGKRGQVSETFWNWKHNTNPFGESVTLLGFSDNQLVGLRTFMKWRFVYGDRLLQGYRAVDTATHPDFHGRGIFSKLTMQLVDLLKQQGPAFIYNTPNDQSKPGYLKMGWQVVGKTPLMVRPVLWNLLFRRLTRSKNLVAVETRWTREAEEVVVALLPAWKQRYRQWIITDYSVEYLKWRYVELAARLNYGWRWLRDGANACFVFYRVKVSRGVVELRLEDVLFDGPAVKPLVRKLVKSVMNETRPDVVTCLRDPEGTLPSMLPGLFVSMRSAGLTVTTREINDPVCTAIVTLPENWFFTTGTLELF